MENWKCKYWHAIEEECELGECRCAFGWENCEDYEEEDQSTGQHKKGE